MLIFLPLVLIYENQSFCNITEKTDKKISAQLLVTDKSQIL